MIAFYYRLVLLLFIQGKLLLVLPCLFFTILVLITKMLLVTIMVLQIKINMKSKEMRSKSQI